jgi:hypothetical protein
VVATIILAGDDERMTGGVSCDVQSVVSPNAF